MTGFASDFRWLDSIHSFFIDFLLDFLAISPYLLVQVSGFPVLVGMVSSRIPR